jgi:methionyl-tRNA formyltransferase
MGAALLVQTLEELNTIEPRPQASEDATLAPLLSREDGRLNWHRSAADLHDQVRGLHPWPGAWTLFRGDRLKIHATRKVDELSTIAPGTVIGGVRIATGQGVLELVEAQAPGKRSQSAGDFANGARLQEGEVLG